MFLVGLTSCIFSAIAAKAVQRSISREILISFAAIVHLSTMGFIYNWQIYPSIPICLIIMPIIFGLCDAVWQTSCNILISKVAGNEHRLAFTNFRVLQSLGLATSSFLSFFGGFSLKIAFLVVNLLISVLCYAIIENRIRRAELSVKDHERLIGAFKQLTVVMGAPGIRSNIIRSKSQPREDPTAAQTSNSTFALHQSHPHHPHHHNHHHHHHQQQSSIEDENSVL